MVGSPHSPARGGMPAVATIAVGSFVLVTSEFLPIGVLPRLSAAFGVSTGTAGLIVTMTGLVAALAAPAVIVAASGIDRRTVMLAFTVLLVANNLLVAVAPAFVVAILARILLGVAVGGFWTIGPTLAARLVPEASVAKATTLITAGVSVGTVVGLPVGAFVGHVTSWRFAFIGTAALAAVVLAAQLRLLPAMPTAHTVRIRDLAGVARHGPSRAGLVASALLIVGNFTAYTFITPYLEQDVHVSASVVSTVLIGFGIAGLAGNFLSGAAVTRSIRAAFLGVVVTMGGSVALLTVAAHTMGLALALVIVWGIAFGATPMAMQTWMMEAAPGNQEEALALFLTVVQLALATGSSGGGVVVDAVGIPWAFAAGAAIIALAGLSVLLRREPLFAPAPGPGREAALARSPVDAP